LTFLPLSKSAPNFLALTKGYLLGTGPANEDDADAFTAVSDGRRPVFLANASDPRAAWVIRGTRTIPLPTDAHLATAALRRGDLARTSAPGYHASQLHRIAEGALS
jgi:hypothetical protein